MIEPETWDAFVAAHPAGTVLQTNRWAQLKATFGWDWEIVTPEAVPNSGALVFYRTLPLKVGTIAYVPRGPLVDWNDAQAVAATLDLPLPAGESEASYLGRITGTLKATLRDANAHFVSASSSYDYIQSDDTHPTLSLIHISEPTRPY